MADKPYLSFEHVTKAMAALFEKAMETPDEPVAAAIVDDTGNLVAYAKMDNLRMFSRRHAIRKAYTSAIMGQDSGAHGDNVRAGGRIVADMGDPMLTPNQGGLVIRKDGVILGGIGVGGYPSGQRDEDLARVGLDAMGL